jgi:hypothetical protein
VKSISGEKGDKNKAKLLSYQWIASNENSLKIFLRDNYE